MKKIIIKNGTIVNASETYKADVLIEDEKISKIGSNFKCDGAEIIDASGKYVMPGGIDVHTHMDIDVGIGRAVDDFYTGTIAAACGGTTTIVDHMGFGPKDCNVFHQLKYYHTLADNKAVIDYSFHGVLQHVDEDVLKGLEVLAKEEGLQSTKLYLTYNYKIEDDNVVRVLQKMKEINGVSAFHAENHYVVEYLKKKFVEEGKTSAHYHPISRPAEAEAEAVNRIIHLSVVAGNAPVYIVHTSASKSVDEIVNARALGHKNIFSETCPQYLVLTDKEYDREDGLKFVMSPPLRKQEDCGRLWKAIADGHIQVIATDHCPFNYETDKVKGKDNFTKCPNGAGGVEERYPLMFSEGVMKGRISINKFVETLCYNPALIYGLYPQKGAIIPNADADITIIDPNKKSVITKSNMHGACDYTAYEGMELLCSIDTVISRGKIVCKDNKFLGNKGDGKFIKRKTLDHYADFNKHFKLGDYIDIDCN